MKKSILNHLLLVTVLGFLSISAVSQASAIEKHPEHIVFFLHGLMANEMTFEGMEKALHQDFGDRIITKNLTYPTAPADCNFENNDWIHPLHFAMIVNTKITDFFYTNDIDIHTPYSLVVHSQGGLTAMVYLNTCMHTQDETNQPWCPYMKGVRNYIALSRFQNSDQYKSEEFQTKLSSYMKNNPHDKRTKHQIEESLFYDSYPMCSQFRDEANALLTDAPKKRDKLEGYPAAPNVQNLISLGTPFWGSATANRGNSMRSLLDSNLIDNMTPLEQLKRLAIGSRGTSWQRMLLLNRNATKEKDWSPDTRWTSPYPEDLKVYNLAGDLWEGSSFWSSSFTTLVGSSVLFKLSRYESDIIVGAPSARLDTIYNIENYYPNGHPNKGVTNITREYFASLLPHIPIGGLPGMAQVNPEERNDHPAYLIVKRALENSLSKDGTQKEIMTEEERKTHLAESVENFNSEIKLISPHGYHRKFSIPRTNVKIEADNPHVFDDLQVKNSLYAVGHGPNNNAMKIKHHYFQTYFHIGKFSDDYHFSPIDQNRHENSIADEAWDNYGLNYKIKVHGFEEKELSNMVAPSYTSYTEGYLTPFHPISNNQVNDQTDQNDRIVGIYKNFDSRQANVIELTDDMKLKMTEKSIDELSDFEYSQLQLGPGDQGRCYVGTMGLETPDWFRHQVFLEDEIVFDGIDRAKDEDGQVIRKDVAKMKLIRPNYATLNGSGEPVKQYEGLTGTQLWEKYAPNKNYVYRYYLDQVPHSEDIDLIRFGSTVEVLGRYSVGKIDDKSKTGRSCTNQEILHVKQGKPWADYDNCSDPSTNLSVDRYLITSPEIRQADGVDVPALQPYVEYSQEIFEANSSFSLLKEANGRIPGTRWVNVVDIDLFDEYFFTLSPNSGYVSYHKGNSCLMGRPNTYSDQYAPSGINIRYFYRFSK